MRVDYLNHASVVLGIGGIELLCDPWLEGTAFSAGWGLRYHNPDALERAAAASHLWISHWHSDHLHPATLAKLAQRNRRITVLANVSANFSMVERLRGAGFGNVVPLGERTPIEIAPGVTVERFPTAGIDNALALRAGTTTVLNYNDCNLPARAIAALRRRVGPIDLLLNNYNHAGKLFRRLDSAAQKREQLEVFAHAAALFEPRFIVPFASSHYYRAPDSLEQNLSLLAFDELERWGSGDPRLLVLRIGDGVEIDERTWHTRWQRRTPALVPVDLDVLAYTTRVGWDELLATANAHCAKLKVAFPVLSRATGALRVWVHDHGRGLSLDCHAGARELPDGQCDIAASSQPLHDWLGRAFGADTFFAGAHFGLRNEDTRAIERWALLTLLDASHLTERDALRYAGSREGRAFLWARREEIVATLGSGRVRAARMRI